MTLRSIRRYPVKSMGGEDLQHVDVDRRGLVGDRWYAVVDDDGKLASGKSSRRFRRHDAVFEHRATTRSDGAVEVSWGGGSATVEDPVLDAHLSEAMGAMVRVLPETSTPHFDSGQVSLVGSATLAWCEERWGVAADPRRLRANLVVETDEPFVEDDWVGRPVAVGEVRLAVAERIPRCRMIDIDQDGAIAPGDGWLKRLAAERDTCAAVYLDVERGGALRVGDDVVVGPLG